VQLAQLIHCLSQQHAEIGHELAQLAPDVVITWCVCSHQAVSNADSVACLAAVPSAVTHCVQAMLRDAETVTVPTATVSSIIEGQQLQ
jgi:hypothetical protein